MPAKFQHTELRLVSPAFDSPLIDALMELNHLRRFRLAGRTKPWLFFQLKEIFHLLESVGSARIEGNRTTVSEYIERKLENKERSTERLSEIANVEQAMEYIESEIDEGDKISHKFIRDLHQLTVAELNDEGDRTPGAYRAWNVKIESSNHLPPDHITVQSYMDEFINFLNEPHEQKYDLIKVAITHHRFVWIHPFGNGNGRVVRLLTYALLIKYGFKVKYGQLLNPTAVFCNDRAIYYNQLSIADGGTDEDLLTWCEYVLTGICDEIKKVNKLLNHEYLVKSVLNPALWLSRERGLINEREEIVLKMGVQNQSFKAGDIAGLLPELSSRQRTHLISRLKENKMIHPVKKNGREYFVVFSSSYLIRGLIETLENENFIPAIN